MSQSLPPVAAAPTAVPCDPAARITKSLLGYGVLAGPSTSWSRPFRKPLAPGSTRSATT